MRSAVLETLRCVQHDVLSRRQAPAFFSVEAIRHRLRTRRWLAVRRGVYLTAPGKMSWEQRRWVAPLAAAPDPEGGMAFVAGAAALHLWGLRGLAYERIDLLLPAGRTLARPPRAGWSCTGPRGRRPQMSTSVAACRARRRPARPWTPPSGPAPTGRLARSSRWPSSSGWVDLPEMRTVLAGRPRALRQDVVAQVRAALIAAGRRPGC